jgi:hypothetical protein
MSQDIHIDITDHGHRGRLRAMTVAELKMSRALHVRRHRFATGKLAVSGAPRTPTMQ